ncbi:MAG: acyltransferase family protein [Acidobacteria bacterium]|nr:acyltransferase family protein [Acidobacteriota bacterium]
MPELVTPPRETRTEAVPRTLRLPAFDALRAAAATIVFLFHYGGFVTLQSATTGVEDSLSWLAARLGSTGTNLLLLLSGFFIANNVASGRFSYSRFVALRLVRIYIPYLTVLLMAVAFAHIAAGFSRADVANASLTTVLRQLLLLPGLFPDHPILTVTWTLSYIVAGYLLFPLLGFAIRRWELSLGQRMAIWAAVTGLSLASGLLWGTPSLRFAYIPAGCLVFETQTRDSWRTRWPRMMLKLAAGGLLFLLIRILLETGTLGSAWPDVPRRGLFTSSGLILASCLVGITLLVQRYEGFRPLMPLLSLIGGFGRTGYSFYLIHGPVVKLFALLVFPILAASHASPTTYWLLMPLCWVLAALAGLILYRIVERPSRQILVRKVGGLADGR